MKSPLPIPILICIPYWSGDIVMARKLAKIIVAQHPGHVKDLAHVLLVHRQDFYTHDKELVDTLSKSFNVHTFQANSPMRGWPDGANGMFGSAMTRVSSFQERYECVYWMEPDCVPLAPNWFWNLYLEWKKRKPGVNIVGCSDGQHITGCAIYHPNIARIMPKISSAGGQAWDWMYRQDILAMGQHTNLIENHYHGQNCDPANANGQAAIIHGYKDFSLLNAVADKFKVKI